MLVIKNIGCVIDVCYNSDEEHRTCSSCLRGMVTLSVMHMIMTNIINSVLSQEE